MDKIYFLKNYVNIPHSVYVPASVFRTCRSTKHLEAKLKPCFIPQHLKEIVQIEKIKEFFSDHMACLACSPLLFCIKIKTTQSLQCSTTAFGVFYSDKQTFSHGFLCIQLFLSKTLCLLVPSEPNSSTGNQCAQLQHCRSKMS